MSQPTWDLFARQANRPRSHTVQGTVISDPAGADVAEYVIFAPPDYWRIEDGEHHLRYLANDAGHFRYPAGGGPVACFTPRRPGHWHSGGMASPALIMPRDLVHPHDDDFTSPLGPVKEIRFLSRRAWRVVLAPPAHKPNPLVQVIDADTGVTLAYESPDGKPILAFTRVTIGTPVPTDVFATPPA